MSIIQTNNDKIHESLDTIKRLLDPKNVESTNKRINLSYNRIVFGAPGTGKSHQLKEDSKYFTNQSQIKMDVQTIIKTEVMAAKEKKNFKALFNAIGFKYAKDLPNNYKGIEAAYGKNTYEIWVGVKASEVIPGIEARRKIYEQNEDNSIENNIKEELKLIKKDIEKNANALGFVYGSYLSDMTLAEITETFNLVSSESLGYWLCKGAQAFACYEDFKQETVKFLERVTFHPNYSYANFVGTYKPVQDSIDEEKIKYEYVPGPFMRVYVNAKNNPSRDFLIIIEEINRANVAAVFGDVFQLLDRYADGKSVYPIEVSEDIKKYLKKSGIQEDELSLPSNMYIWASMNSADQGVFPVDTAFKRRWSFEYIGIDDSEYAMASKEIPIGNGKKVVWNELRKAINNKLVALGVNEDKLLGPFFISDNMLDSALDDIPGFIKHFESKVLMYLFEDAAKMKAKQLFKVGKYIYSEVCKKFESDGIGVFDFLSDIEIKDIVDSSELPKDTEA